MPLMNKIFSRFGPATIVVACCATGGFAAETTAPAKPPVTSPQTSVSEEPVNTTASFGDWILRCQRLAESAKLVHICEVAQTIQVEGQQGPVAQIAIGRLSNEKPLQVTVALPNNVSFPSVVQMNAKDKNRELGWSRCTPGGCFATATLPDDVLKVWRATTEAGKIDFKDAAGREIGVPFSFRGLSQSLDALAKEM